MDNQKDAAQGFVFLQGNLDTATVEDNIKKAGLDPKKTVYIFPGNSGHHTPSSTLFSEKVGAGLAAVALDVGRNGIPTLSLPTRDVNSENGIPSMSQTAVEDLWKAVGYDFSLALPVREKYTSGKIFENPLNGTDVEPSFWGGIVSKGDSGLAKYYLEELDRLRSFLDGTPDQKQQILEELNTKFPEAHLAYQAGQNAKTSDTLPDWFKPNDQQPVAKKVSDADIPVTPPATPQSKSSSEKVESQVSESSDPVKKSENTSTAPLLDYLQNYNANLLKELERLMLLHHPTTASEILEIQKQAAANTAEFFAKMAQTHTTAKTVVNQQEYDWGPVVLDNSKPPTVSFFTNEEGEIFTDGGRKFAIETRSGTNELNNAQNRHITPIAMLKRHVKKLLLGGRTIEEASKIILDMSEIILEDLREFSKNGAKTIIPKEEIISKFYEYFKSNPERLTGDKNKDDFIIVFQRLFSTYAMAPYGVLPTEGNTPEPKNERQIVKNALDLFERYEQKTIEKFALQGKIARGELQADDEEVKKSLAENTLTDAQLEQIASKLFEIFDYKALPAETKEARKKAIFSTNSIKKTTEAQNHFPEQLQEDFKNYAADQEKKLKEQLLADNPTFKPRGKNKKETDFKTYLQEIKSTKKIADPILFQTEGLKSFPQDLSKTIKTTAEKLSINIDTQKYNAHAIVDSWRYDDEPLERLFELTARHLGLFFLFTPNLQDEYQTEIMNKFLDKVYNEHNARLTADGLDREQFGAIMWDKILDKYPYFYDFQYKPEQRDGQFEREAMVKQLADFYVDKYYETLLSFPVSEETIKELPESLQKMPFEQIQNDIETAQENYQQELNELPDSNDKIKYLEAQIASHTRMQHLLSRKSTEGIRERQLKILQTELETLNHNMENKTLSKKREELEKAIKAWQEPLARVSEDVEEKIQTLQQQLETYTKLSILDNYTFKTLLAESKQKDISEIRIEQEGTIGAEHIVYPEDFLPQSPTDTGEISTKASKTQQLYGDLFSQTPSSEDEEYDPEDHSSDDYEDWGIEFDDLFDQEQANLNEPKEIPTLGDGNCAFNAMALGIADLARTNQFPKIETSDTLNHRRTEFYALLQKELDLQAPTQKAFKTWLKNKNNYEIQTSLAPLIRNFVVDRIRADEEYNTNYKENYESTLVGAFNSFLNGRMHEDDTFVVHKFIQEKFESLKSASLLSLSNADEKRDFLLHIRDWWNNNLKLPNQSAAYLYNWFKENFDNPTLSVQEIQNNLLDLVINKKVQAGNSPNDEDVNAIKDHINNLIDWWKQQKTQKQNHELLNWWRTEGKKQYFDNLSQSASDGSDTQRWASDIELNALALDLGINLTWEKNNFASAVFGPGNGLIPINKDDDGEIAIFDFLRDAGLGYEYQGYFRLADNIKSREDLQRLLNKASDNVFEFLKDFELGDGQSYNVGKSIVINPENQHVVQELRERGLLNIDNGNYYLATPDKNAIDAALNGLGDNQELRKKILMYFDPSTPNVTVKHEGIHWTYMRSPEIRQILVLNNSSSESNLQQKKLVEYTETIQAEAHLKALEIKLSDTGIKMSSPDTLEQKKLIDYLIENNINFMRDELEIHLNSTETQKLIRIINPIIQKALDETTELLASLKLVKTPPSISNKRKALFDSEDEELASEEDNGVEQDSEEESVDSRQNSNGSRTQEQAKRRRILKKDTTPSTDSKAEGLASKEGDGLTQASEEDTTSSNNTRKRKIFIASESEEFASEEDNGIAQNSEEEKVDSRQNSIGSWDREQAKRQRILEKDTTPSTDSKTEELASKEDDGLKQTSDHSEQTPVLSHDTLAERYTEDTNHSHKWEDFVHKVENEEAATAEKSETKTSSGISEDTDTQRQLQTSQETTVPNSENPTEPIKQEDAENLLHFFNNPTFGKR